MPQFSTHEAVSLEKEVDLQKQNLLETKPEDIDVVYEINKCAEWIKTNGYKKVCLQFPDYLLPDSSEVALKLDKLLNQNVYILGDTAYESCCIDYIAAAHINADAIVHFGPTCFSKTSANIPYLNIYEKYPLDLNELEKIFLERFGEDSKKVKLVLDSEYFHKLGDIANIFKSHESLKILKIDEDLSELENSTVIMISSNQRKILNIKLTHHPLEMYLIHPNNSTLYLMTYEIDPKILKRRYFLIEKIKDSKTIGIVIGTLGVKNYLKVINRVKQLATLGGKKYYMISVGKPTVAKLANFPEIDIYVMITCSLNEIYDSREFYKPIVTPYHVEQALNPSEKILQFSYDYNQYLNNLEDIDVTKVNENETDVSLLNGNIRCNKQEDKHTSTAADTSNQIAIRTDGTIALSSSYGAGFLADRSWKGLEQNLGQTEVKLAEQGRKGIAQGYENEPE